MGPIPNDGPGLQQSSAFVQLDSVSAQQTTMVEVDGESLLAPQTPDAHSAFDVHALSSGAPQV
jgi:hypothetical protein